MGKKTFVFDLDWAKVLRDYSPEIRLEVYDAIVEYAASGTFPKLKPVANMAFSFIKLQMDYNLEQYEKSIEQRRQAGRNSATARARSTTPTFAEFVEQSQQPSTESTDVESVERNERVSTTPTDVESVERNERASTKSTDIDIVIDIDKLLTLPLGVGGEQGKKVREAYLDVFFGAPIRTDSFIKRWETDLEELREMCDTVLDEWTVFNERHPTAEDARKHFVSAVRTRYENKIRQKQNAKSSKNGGPCRSGNSGPKVRPGTEEPGCGLVD